jgi:hypothetical protein
LQISASGEQTTKKNRKASRRASIAMGATETITVTIKGNYNSCEKTYGLPTIWAKNRSLMTRRLFTWRASASVAKGWATQFGGSVTRGR